MISTMRDVFFRACGQLDEDARLCAFLTADHTAVDTTMLVAHAVARVRTPLWIVPAGRAAADTVR
eukprot:9483954-Alexandrium_andersonii.AAC.1